MHNATLFSSLVTAIQESPVTVGGSCAVVALVGVHQVARLVWKLINVRARAMALRDAPPEYRPKS